MLVLPLCLDVLWGVCRMWENVAISIADDNKASVITL